MDRNIGVIRFCFLRKAHMQIVEIRQAASLEYLIQSDSKFRLASVFMCYPQQVNNGLGSLAQGPCRGQRLPCAAVFRSGKKRITIGQVCDGTGLGAQAVNHMMNRPGFTGE